MTETLLSRRSFLRAAGAGAGLAAGAVLLARGPQYNAAGTPRCAAGGLHHVGAWNYTLPFGINESNYQNGWHACHRCACYFWSGWLVSSGGNFCVANGYGKHAESSATPYQLVFS